MDISGCSPQPRRREFDVIVAEDTSRIWRNLAEQSPRLAEQFGTGQMGIDRDQASVVARVFEMHGRRLQPSRDRGEVQRRARTLPCLV